MKKFNTLISQLFTPSVAQARDTGLAMVLISLLLAYFGEFTQFVPIAIILLLITMIYPLVFRPIAWFWFGLSHLLGTIASKVILSVAFFVVVTPIGMIRRASGADVLHLKEWKKDRKSVFHMREHQFSASDIEKPF